MNGERETNMGVLERHAQSVALAVAVATILYSASFVVKVSEDSAIMRTQLLQLTQDVARLTGLMQIVQQNTVTREEFREQDRRIREMENRIPGLIESMRSK